MGVSRALQLLVLLAAGLCQARPDGTGGGGGGGVPLSQLRMLSLGLSHLLHGVEENAEQLERQREQVAAELDGTTGSLEGLHKQSLQAGRTHRKVRKDLQVQSARWDGLWRTTKDLQRGLEDLDSDQRATQNRMNRILQTVTGLTEPRSSGGHLDVAAMKVVLEKQSRRLASLTSEVSARDRLIARRLQRIEHLEKLVPDSVPAALRPHSDSGCV